MSEILFRKRDLLTVSILISFFLLGSVLFTYGLENIGFYVNWIVGVIFVGLSLFNIFFVKRKIKKPIFYAWFLLSLWIPLVVILTPFARDKSLHFTFILLSFFYISYSILVVHYLLESNKRFVGTLFWLNVAWCLVNIVYLILYIFGYHPYDKTEFSGIFENRNRFAIVTTILFYFNLNNRNFFEKKKLINIILIINIIFIFITISLKGFIGLSLILILHYWNDIKRINKKPMILVILLLLVAVLFTNNPVRERLDRFIQLYKNPESLSISGSAFERYWLVKEGLKVSKGHLLTGVGVNNSRYYLITPYHQLLIERGSLEKQNAGSYSHNNYLEMLLNGGIFTFMLFYLPIIIIIIVSIRSSSFKKTFKTIYILLIYKLILDIAMVSYFDLAHTIILAFSFVLFYKLKYQTPVYD